MTRTVTCNGTTWEADETWDKSNCACDPNSEPSTEQACASGCGGQTRTNTCVNGEWAEGEWQGTCYNKGTVSKNCTYGGTQTRTATCNVSTNRWTYGTWDKSKCECDSTNEPSTSQTCSSGCGTQTRTNSCVNGEWVAGTWTGTCETKPSTSAACTSGSGTMTRTPTCNADGTWTAGSWDMSSCVCDNSTKPASSESCSDGCETGSRTRTVTCVNGSWSSGRWGSCSADGAPAGSYWCPELGACYTGGYATRTVTCSGGKWVTGAWDSSSCSKKEDCKPRL